jgi:hypothetical protein
MILWFLDATVAMLVGHFLGDLLEQSAPLCDNDLVLAEPHDPSYTMSPTAHVLCHDCAHDVLVNRYIS